MPTQPWISVVTEPCRSCSRKRPFKEKIASPDEFFIEKKNSNDPLNSRPPRYAKKTPPEFCVAESSFLSQRPSEYCRQNGFERPFNLFQILSWVLFLIVILVLYAILCFSFSVVTCIILGLVSTILIFSTFWSALAVGLKDPSDDRIEIHWNETHHDNNAVGEGETLCDLCGPIDSRSKHCRACNKCVARFDHHCKWLNNCIGEKNYKLFLFLIVSTALLTLFSIIVALVALTLHFTTDTVRDNWFQRLGTHSPIPFYILIGVSLMVNIPLFLLDLQLLLLHAYLVFVGITTYEYITRHIQEPPTPDPAKKQKSSTRCCADWIVINQNQLKKARERFHRKKMANEIQFDRLKHENQNAGLDARDLSCLEAIPV